MLSKFRRPSPPIRPLALTMGEPASIAAEITTKAWEALRPEGPAFCLVGDAALIRGVPVACVASLGEASGAFGEAFPVIHRPLARHVMPGRPDVANAAAVIAAIEHAVRYALDGEAAGVVTNPIQKAVLTAAGFRHPGHTEFLAALCGGFQPVMLLATPGLRTVPVTIHESLRAAMARLDTGSIVRVAQATAEGLRRDFGIAHPRLVVAGLNPHAGEAGTMGTEDRDIVAPAVAVLRAAGIDAHGPLPADTLFTPSARASYDCAICMYHDQALIPVKTLDMAGGVNVTLGLPIVRTSPDHGTALDIAGQGRADASSLIAAIRLAGDIAHHRARSAA